MSSVCGTERQSQRSVPQTEEEIIDKQEFTNFQITTPWTVANPT